MTPTIVEQRSVLGGRGPALIQTPIASLSSSSSETRDARVAYLSNLTGHSAKKIETMASKNPKLLQRRIDPMRAKITELSAMTGCSEQQVGKMVAGFPPLLGLNADSMRGTITELSAITGCSEQQVGKMVAGFPQLLGMNVPRNTKPTMEFLVSRHIATHDEVRS